ncbi:MAG: hypothetical protein P9M03_01055 [Candidatus Theseobacter exili]|nr:hypothetical protein [Candidatus Theseobacter exili]
MSYKELRLRDAVLTAINKIPNRYLGYTFWDFSKMTTVPDELVNYHPQSIRHIFHELEKDGIIVAYNSEQNTQKRQHVLTFEVKDCFENIYFAWCRQKEICFDDLSFMKREVIHDFLKEIYCEFELSSNTKMKFKAPEDINILFYLLHNHVFESFVHNYDYIPEPCVDIEINAKIFLNFLLEIEKQNSNTDTSNKIQFPIQCSWEDIAINFLDGHYVKISAADYKDRFNFVEMGFENKNTRLPNKQWLLLELLANSNGCIDWEDTEANSKLKKQKQLLSKKLQLFFNIHSDPFYPYHKEKSYRIKIKLIPY